MDKKVKEKKQITIKTGILSQEWISNYQSIFSLVKGDLFSYDIMKEKIIDFDSKKQEFSSIFFDSETNSCFCSVLDTNLLKIFDLEKSIFEDFTNNDEENIKIRRVFIKDNMVISINNDYLNIHDKRSRNKILTSKFPGKSLQFDYNKKLLACVFKKEKEFYPFLFDPIELQHDNEIIIKQFNEVISNKEKAYPFF